MSILVQCPNPDCNASSIVEDSISGRNVKCKRCGKPFVAKATFDGHKSDTKKEKAASSTNPFPVLPAEFGRYRILRQLGRGGMGAVYLAQDTQLGRQVALKVPFFDASESPQRVERFVREARSAAVLQHPNICTVFDAGQIDGRPFITMAYIAGTPLEKEIDRDKPMPQVRAAEIVRKIALALQHAHLTGIVHRDLKPANVMMAAGGEPVVMDFGLAKRVADVDPNEAKLTRDGGLLGTPSYMAPEQVKGDSSAIGPATDVYALGVILFEMLTGRTPYSGGITVVIGQILAAPAPPVKEFRPDVDFRLDAICRKAMAKEPADRFKSMTELADALSQYLKAPTASLPPSQIATVVRAAPPVAAVRTAFDDLEVAPRPIAVVKKVKRSRIAKTPPPWKKWPILAGAAAAVSLAILLVLWAVGVFKVKTPDGVLVVQVNEPNAEVFVDGARMTVSWNEGGTKAEIHVKPGARKVEVRKEGFSVDGKELTVKDGDREVFTARLIPDEPRIAKAEPTTEKSLPPSDPKKPDAPMVPGATPVADGFVPLFNGKDMTGWTALNGAPPGWEVKDGYLEVAPGKGDVRTKETFGPDFILHAEFWLPLMPNATGQARANSGIFLQGRYELQILDSYMNDTYPDGSIGALYRLIAPEKEAQQKAIRRPEQWQYYDVTFHAPRVDEKGTVVAKGRITVVLNDVTIINDGQFDKITPGGTEDKLGAPGPIRLQEHGAKVRFRNIGIKELTTAPSIEPVRPDVADKPPVKEPENDDKGFVPLFNGKDLTGWKKHLKQPGNWRVKDGVLFGSGPISHLFTERGDYKDFHLRAEVRVNENGNSGIYFHAPFALSNSEAFPGGYEVQILHHYNQPGFLTGSLVGFVKAPNLTLAADEWFTMDVIAVGNELTTKVNNQITAHYVDENRISTEGHFALQVWKPATTMVQFRKIEIKELTPTKTKTGSAPPADAFQSKSVWVNTDGVGKTLTVLERKGETFQAQFVVGAGIVREVTGTVKDGKLSWLAKDVRAVKGGPGQDNQATITRDKDGDLLDFTYSDKGRVLGSFVLRLKTSK